MAKREEKTGWIQAVCLAPPSLADNTADADRLIGKLKAQLGADIVDVDLDLVRELPGRLRAWNYRVRCVLFCDRGRWVLAGVTEVSDAAPACGMACDLGTSRVVLRLVDLATGKTLGESAFDNPQITVGPDVLARIHHAATPDGRRQLNRLIVDGINGHAGALCRASGVGIENVYLFTVAGNTAMSHLFLGLDPHWIIREPYIPVVNRPGVMRAAEVGLDAAPQARVLVFPNIGSYFGGDLIAGILFSGLGDAEETAILVDVGTNAEVVLGNRNWLIACAGAAGPALEGGVTRMGMMAGPGVIDRVRIDGARGTFDLHTIADGPPRGICGSGLIDLAAQLFGAGMVDIRGKLVPDRCGGRIKTIDGISHLVVVPATESGTGQDLTIGQVDLDSLVRSKAAMYTILETITGSVGMAQAEIETFYVAGTFGSFIDPVSAITIGMIPDLPLSRYRSLGNSSLGGAAMVLTDPGALDKIDAIRDRITYLELNVNQDFMNRFSAAKFIPHTDRARFPSVVWPA
ncbi:MAG: DUF4445 domain-containing protein [Desulfobacterales bacterium]|nr:DUF4445 domain-containing protein [Desulfobacterales bacterium]